MVVSAGLAGYHAYRTDNRTFYVGALFYGYLLEQVAISVFNLYGYPLGAYVLTALDVPFAIALGWAAIIYAGYTVGVRMGLTGVGIAAFTGLFGWHIDLLMDPVATRIGLWEWFETVGWFDVPPNNYFGWYLVAFVYTLTFVLVGRYVEDGVKRLAATLVVSIPVLVGTFQGWLFVTGGRLEVETVILAAILLASVVAVIRNGVRAAPQSRILFYAMAIFPVFFGAFYVVEGLYRSVPGLGVVLVVSAALTYVLFHPGPPPFGGLDLRTVGSRLRG